MSMKRGNLSLQPTPTPRELAATLFRRKKVIGYSFASILTIAMLIVFFSARYESHFKVLLRRGRFDPVASGQPPGTMDVTRPEVTEEELNSEVELLRDEDLLKQVVSMAGLIPADTLASEREAEVEHAVRKLGRRLDVDSLKKSNLIQVTYKDADAERAGRVLSALATIYMNKHTSLQRPSGEIQFFEQQRAESEKNLRRSEDELVNFTRTQGVVSAATERDIALLKLGEADANLRQINQDRAETEQTITALDVQLKSFPSRSVTLKRWADNPELLAKMKEHLLDLELKRTELLTRFDPSYRLVQEVEQEIEEAKASIAAEALTPARDETSDKDPNYEWARMELEKAEVRRDGLQAREGAAVIQVSALHTFARNMQASSVDQQDLVRTAKADEDAYLLYVHKREEARIGDALDQQQILNVAIVEPPAPPALPVHPMLLYFLLAAGLSSFASIGLGFAAEYFDSTIRTPDEASQLLEVPVLAWLPAAEAEAIPRSAVQLGRRKGMVE
jgi:succinoglycan biosynthesis transport protein ExoP